LLEGSPEETGLAQDAPGPRIVVAGPFLKSLVLLVPWGLLDLWVFSPSSLGQFAWPLILGAVLTLASVLGFWLASAAGFEPAPLVADLFEEHLEARQQLAHFGKSIALVSVLSVVADAAEYLALSYHGVEIGSGTVRTTGNYLRDAGFYFEAATVEEIIFRLFLTSLALVLVKRALPQWSKGRGGFWAANLLQAVAFGAAHVWNGNTAFHLLPWWLCPLGVGQAWVGVALGYTFFHYGVEATVFAHFLTDYLTVLLLLLLSAGGPRPLLLAWRLT